MINKNFFMFHSNLKYISLFVKYAQNCQIFIYDDNRNYIETTQTNVQ